MSFDGGFCRALMVSLRERLIGAKVEKVHTPSGDSIQLLLYRSDGIVDTENGKARRASLIISTNPTLPRINFEEAEGDNPSSPSPFCMLLRKHLVSATITDISQQGYDRIIYITLAKRDELGYAENRTLCLELMGKYSNTFLLNGDAASGTILGCARSADLTESKRLTLNGALYEPPEQDKLNPSDIRKSEFLSLIFAAVNSEKRVSALLLQLFSGFSPLISREVAFRASGSTEAVVSAVEPERLWVAFTEIVEDAKAGGSPFIVYDSDNKPVAYSFTKITQYGSLDTEAFSDIFALQSKLKQRKTVVPQDSRKRELQRLVESKLAKLHRVQAMRQAELIQCQSKDEYKNIGDLITASIYMLKQGQEFAMLPDYENGGEIKVELDTKLSPAANAQRYYKKYRKLRVAEEKQNQLLKEADAEINYLETIVYSLVDAKTERELEDIRSELAANGYASQNKKTTLIHKTKKSEPKSFTTSGGYLVRVGKNNIQNDQLTFSADKDDIWFHVKNRPGSHVILYTNGEEPPAQDYTEAAQLAAYYSDARESDTVEVDYTKRRYVKKPSGSKPGFVIYDKYYTATVAPKNISDQK